MTYTKIKSSPGNSLLAESFIIYNLLKIKGTHLLASFILNK